MTIRYIWDSIPEELKELCYEYIGTALTFPTTYGLLPLINQKLVDGLTKEQLFLICALRYRAFYERMMNNG